MDIEVSIVIPCLNESETLGTCIHEALYALESKCISGEVLVVDNGSVDSSKDIARKLGARVVHCEQKGYGHALLKGIEAARGRFVLMGDADGSYDFSELPHFLERLRQGNDLVMGCRFPRLGGKILPGAMPWKHRWLGNPILTGLGKLFFSTPVQDFHCGLRAFRRQAILQLNLRTGGMEFATEMVMKASLSGLKISQLPITLRPDGRGRSSHLRSWRDGWRHLRFMLLYSPNWLFMYPGLFLTITGLIGFAVLVPEPLTVKSVTFDLNSLLVSSVAILVGFQVLAFGTFIKAYAVNSGLLPGKTYWFKMVKGRAAEWGMAFGLAFILVGLSFLTSAVLDWQAADFGALSYQTSLRKVISATTGIGLGIQIMFYGFALNILGLEQ